jgi:hypothetical protein
MHMHGAHILRWKDGNSFLMTILLLCYNQGARIGFRCGVEVVKASPRESLSFWVYNLTRRTLIDVMTRP